MTAVFLCCIFAILTIMHMGSTRMKRYPHLPSTQFIRYLNASRAVPTIESTYVIDSTNTTLWDLYGCDKKKPLFSCQPPKPKPKPKPPKGKQPIGKGKSKDKPGELLGNVVVVNRTDFNHPLLQKKSENCAVVGSSGRLLKEEWGKDIDQHDVVVRINYPPIKGYEKYAGSRQPDILFFSDKMRRCFNESFHPESQLVVFPLPLDIDRKRMGFEVCKENNDLRMLPMSNYVYDHTKDLIYNYSVSHRPPGTKIPRRKHPSAGFRAVFFCMMICKNVDLYGFGISDYKDEPVHYYEKHTDKTHFVTTHSPDVEFKLLVNWTKTASAKDLGKVRLF